jgi:hypothetical protein
MRRRKYRLPALGGPLILAAALGVSSYAFTASNTVPDGARAGQGAATITGFTIGAPTYTLLTSDPSKITSFAFTISTVDVSTLVKASLVGTTYIACSLGTITAGSATATCSYGSGAEPAVSAATSFSVVAAN